VAHSLTYIYGYDDFAALIRAKRSIGPMGKLGPITPYLAVSALYLVLIVSSLAWDNISPAEMLKAQTLLLILAGIPVVMVLVAVINLVFMRLVYRLIFQRFALADKEITVILDESGIKWSGDGFAGQCIWSKVKRVVENDERLFLFISKVEGLVLPRRAAASDRAFRELAAYVREHAND
jgi:hypothetical protein